MQHVEYVGGDVGMHIDHHNPNLPDNIRHSYENLFLASAHCNGKKGKRWPSAEQQKLGLRYLNPCKELDYGYHIFEDPDTFEVWGATAAGVYHIRMLDLNASHLVNERRRRFQLRALLESPNAVFFSGVVGVDNSTTRAGIAALHEDIELKIPLIPQRKKPRLSAETATKR